MLIRSKNAGPFQLTIDVMFSDPESYERVLSSGVLDPQLFSDIYGTPLEEVRIMPYDAAHSIKVTIPRPLVSGDSGDGDMMGGQQYGPLVELEIP